MMVLFSIVWVDGHDFFLRVILAGFPERKLFRTGACDLYFYDFVVALFR